MITSNLVEKAEEINRTKLGKFNKTYKGTKVGIMGELLIQFILHI